ncbi:MAG: FAD-binding oxidoreductase [Flavobacteriaceae bacterium]
MIDYIIVGLGLAGVSFCEQLERNDKTFKVINDDSQTSSKVAGGMYNPVILKRFTLAWMAKEQLEIALPLYCGLERKLQTKFNYTIPVLRRFATMGEQNLWFEASDKAGLDYFLSDEILANKNVAIDAPFGYGQVLYTGRIDTKKLLSTFGEYLLKQNKLIEETFDYDALRIEEGHVEYKSVKAKRIVFAEGFGLRKNPYFKYLPLQGTKGELLTIRAPSLKEANVIKASVFSIPLGDDLYRVGATYKWKDKTNLPTEEAKEELLAKLNAFLRCDYEVVDHVAGIRPTVTDRMPLVGRHLEHKNLYVLNGFGSRGVMVGPYAAKQLFDAIEHRIPINKKMNIERFAIH